MERTIYLAGPMTGIPQFNHPAFMAAATLLRAEGHTVFNPVENDMKKYGEEFIVKNKKGDAEKAAKAGFSLRKALKDDLVWICENADTIALLPGWEKSAGARVEWALAIALDMDIFYIGDLV